MLRNGQGEILTPSIVLFDDDQVVVGEPARECLATRPHDIAQCAKRDVGKMFYSRPVHGQNLPPEVIQASILQQIKVDLTGQLTDSFKAVITVPAFFDERRRKSTSDAGEMAGIEVLDIVNEPTAAALAYGEHLGYLTTTGAPREAMKVLVYDLGGGTFDVTMIDLKPGDLRTLATDGDVQLGGRDWDQRLADYAAGVFQSQFGDDPRLEASSCAKLYESVEQAKKQLSVRASAKVRVEHFGRELDVPVTRLQFEELTEDLLERTAYTTRQVLEASKTDWDDVARILLVGGSTRMPMVVKMLEELSGITPDHSVNPDEAVARGAAIYASYLLSTRGEGGAPSFKVVDVNSHSLGIEGIDQRTGHKENITLIPRNTPLPARVSNRFVTKMKGQQSVVVKVLEGESTDPEYCIVIGKAVMRDLPTDLRKGHPVEVAYRYGRNGRLDVRARIPGTDREVAMELQRDGTISDERLSGWKQVITSEKGFTAFEEMLEDVLNVDGIKQSDESPDDPPLSAKEAEARNVRWSGQPSMPSEPVNPMTSTPAVPTGQPGVPRPNQPIPTQPVSTAASSSAAPEMTSSNVATPVSPTTTAPTDPAGNGAMPIPQQSKRKQMSGWVFAAGNIIAAVVGLGLGALILRWLGIW